MIANIARTRALSAFRWVDAGNLWSYELESRQSQHIHVSDAKWIALVGGMEDKFAVVHHFEDNRVRLTSHFFGNPVEPLSTIELRFGEISHGRTEIAFSKFTGEDSVWALLPKAYLVRLFGGTFAVLIDYARRSARIEFLSWHDASYDPLYQDILGVTEIPGTSRLIFSLQRDSQPVVYDPSSGTLIAKLTLGGDSGAPQLIFRQTAPELWASDYDSLIRLDSRDWKILNRLKLEEGHGGMLRSNIGQFSFGPGESVCLVARPHSGDILAIDSNRFVAIGRAKTGGRPEDVVLLRDDHVVARDLGTGSLLEGVLKFN